MRILGSTLAGAACRSFIREVIIESAELWNHLRCYSLCSSTYPCIWNQSSRAYSCGPIGLKINAMLNNSFIPSTTDIGDRSTNFGLDFVRVDPRIWVWGNCPHRRHESSFLIRLHGWHGWGTDPSVFNNYCISNRTFIEYSGNKYLFAGMKKPDV